MVHGPRTRVRALATTKGGTFTPQVGGLGVYTQDDFDTGFERCVDVVGYKELDNPFYLERANRILGTTSGDCGPYYASDCYSFTGTPGHNPFTTPVPSDNAAVTRAIALTNPSRPHIDVPGFLGELRDMPGMIKELGQLILKTEKAFGKRYTEFMDIKQLVFRRKQLEIIKSELPLIASKGYLGWEFGWAPLISDLGKILGFYEATGKRFRAIKSLAQGRSLSRKLDVWNEDVTSGPHEIYVPVAYGANVRYNFWVTSKWKRWVSIRWTPIEPAGLPQDDTGQLALARGITHGWSGASLSTAWNLMPWTWFIDWFSNAGDIVDTQRNALHLTHSFGCVMTQVDTGVSRYERVPGVQSGVFRLNRDWGFYTKERYTHSASPTFEASVPILSHRQMSILSSLVISNKTFRSGLR